MVGGVEVVIRERTIATMRAIMLVPALVSVSIAKVPSKAGAFTKPPLCTLSEIMVYEVVCEVCSHQTIVVAYQKETKACEQRNSIQKGIALELDHLVFLARKRWSLLCLCKLRWGCRVYRAVRID
jgi:hypothetical protein